MMLIASANRKLKKIDCACVCVCVRVRTLLERRFCRARAKLSMSKCCRCRCRCRRATRDASCSCVCEFTTLRKTRVSHTYTHQANKRWQVRPARRCAMRNETKSSCESRQTCRPNLVIFSAALARCFSFPCLFSTQLAHTHTHVQQRNIARDSTRTRGARQRSSSSSSSSPAHIRLTIWPLLCASARARQVALLSICYDRRVVRH